VNSLKISKLPKVIIEKRVDRPRFAGLIAAALSLVMSILVTSILVASAGVKPSEALASLFLGSVGTRRAILDSLISATPLIITGVSVVFAYKSGVFSIGAEGQLYAGAIAAYWVYWSFPDLPRIPLMISLFLAAVAGGAALGGLAALFKRFFEVDIVISTVLLNYITFLLLSYLLSVDLPWKDPNSFTVATKLIDDKATLPIVISDSRLHAGFLIAIILSIIVYIILEKTPLGYEIKAVGLNDVASLYRGISSTKIMIITMIVSGGIAGLAGWGELFGLQHRLKAALSSNFGYTGILVAVLAGLNPLAVLPAAFLFGGLSNGAFKMQVSTGVETSLIYGIQAMILLLLLVSQAAVTYRIRIIRK